MEKFVKGKDWNNVQAYGTGEVVSLEKGGYVCRIAGAKLEQSTSGAYMMSLAFDIDEGRFKDFYKSQYAARRAQNPNAKYGGVYRQFIFDRDGGTNPFYKGMITSIEKSNNFVLPDEFTDADLKGKLFGGIFGREEFKTSTGEKKWTTKLVGIRCVDVIKKGDFTIPEDKALKESAKGTSDFYTAVNTTAEDEDLPF